MLSRLVITFLPRSKRLNFIAAITICSDLEATKIKSDTVSTVSPSISHVPGAGERHSTRDKSHEEGGSAYAKAGSSLGSAPGYSRASTPKKPESAYFIALCSHL